MLRRSILSVLVPLLAATTLPAQQESKMPPPKIVFVCEHCAAKSVIAVKELEKLARERGISIQAVSRGTTPDPDIPLYVRTGLKADGIEIGTMKPVQVKPEDLRDAARVISFGPDLSAVGGQMLRIDDWGATPDVSGNFPAARDYIVKRLQTLLDQIAEPKR
jgi:arsenate reductase (thioredoxin)